ncbi:DUF4249 family protein [Maribacter sp. HTCC2170]|uniref:DUF4249 family protein n=1 Tax=Maribacter sp. (strain HTCC2170 / KCCM 42371) TaxID=313603 RepID=UPI00006AFCB6|nr:DUF4249 family protein [Maribacter sp. HTCC2170]EAR01268.1 hypothetical protein FB2170_11126 [Maribacter sp. HTCC2170]
MQNYIRTSLLLLIVAFTSCEDVIDVPVQTAQTRLVIEASLDWEKGTTGNEQSITLRTSTAFFDSSSTTAAAGASVTVTNDDSGAVFIFEDQNNGNYTTNEFVPVLGQPYALEVIHDGQTYLATETLTAVPDIIDLYQDTEDGFSDEDIELHVVFNDPPEEGNSYLFVFRKSGELLPDLEVGYDEFVNGNEIDWWYELEDDEDTDKNESLQPDDVVAIEMYGISEAYKNYMEILIDQIGGVGLFEATPVSVKGNCVNATNPDNYAHGYFRLTEVNKVSYTVE